MFHKSLAREVKQVRVRASQSLLEVQNETGINIGRIEMGEHSVTITTLLMLCDYFNISLWEIVMRAETTTEDRQISEKVHHDRHNETIKQ